MNRVTKVASLLGATALAMSMTACGDDSGDSSSASGGGDGYCDELESAGDSLADTDTAMTDPGAMTDMADTFKGIADAAPDDIKEDWNKLSEMFTTMSELDLSDPEAMQDPEVQEKLQGMEDVQANVENIETHAKEECDIDLGSTSSEQ